MSLFVGDMRKSGLTGNIYCTLAQTSTANAWEGTRQQTNTHGLHACDQCLWGQPQDYFTRNDASVM